MQAAGIVLIDLSGPHSPELGWVWYTLITSSVLHVMGLLGCLSLIRIYVILKVTHPHTQMYYANCNIFSHQKKY